MYWYSNPFYQWETLYHYPPQAQIHQVLLRVRISKLIYSSKLQGNCLCEKSAYNMWWGPNRHPHYSTTKYSASAMNTVHVNMHSSLCLQILNCMRMSNASLVIPIWKWASSSTGLTQQFTCSRWRVMVESFVSLPQFIWSQFQTLNHIWWSTTHGLHDVLMVYICKPWVVDYLWKKFKTINRCHADTCWWFRYNYMNYFCIRGCSIAVLYNL